MTSTRAKLTRAAAETLRDDGMAGLSARVIAARAGVNQALVFYHFGTVAELVQTACREAVDDSVQFYRGQFATVGSLGELLTLGRALHERERDAGNVALTAQLLAGAQRDETLAAAARYAIACWTTELETVVRRVLVGTAIAEIAEPRGLARAISAGFIGLELYEGVDPVGGQSALDALERLNTLVETMADLGPLATRALGARLRRSEAQRAPGR